MGNQCNAPIIGTQNRCTADVGHPGEHRCLAVDVDSRKRAKPNYDCKCFDLAEAFLEDTPHLATAMRTDELAALIQTTIENYIAYEQNNYEPPDPPGFEAGFADNH